MRTYTATIEAPHVGEVGEDLRGLGTVNLSVAFEFATRAEALRTLAAEYGWRGMDYEFWDARLSGKRGRLSK